MAMWRKTKSSSGPREASPRTMDGALRWCREALQHDLGDGSRLDALHEPLRLLSICAHHDQLPPERVVIELKQLLREGSALETTAAASRDEIRARVIEMAINTYFADGSSS